MQQQMQDYIRAFYDSLTVGVDKHADQCYNLFMREAALRFFAKGDVDAAYEVYRIFFECYNLEIEGGRSELFEPSAKAEKLRGRRRDAHQQAARPLYPLGQRVPAGTGDLCKE